MVIASEQDPPGSAQTNTGGGWVSQQNQLRGKGCGCVSVPESWLPIGGRGEAAAAGGTMAGPAPWQEVVSERWGGWAAVGPGGAAATGCRTPCAEAAVMWRTTSFG